MSNKDILVALKLNNDQQYIGCVPLERGHTYPDLGTLGLTVKNGRLSFNCPAIVYDSAHGAVKTPMDGTLELPYPQGYQEYRVSTCYGTNIIRKQSKDWKFIE